MNREFSPKWPHRFFVVFFAFGALMCALTVVLLFFPGTPLDALWRLNSDARDGLRSIGRLAIWLMLGVGIACAFAAVGLWRRSRWGVLVALVILAINLCGDICALFLRHDYRTLIGLPIGGAMIIWLLRTKQGRDHRGTRAD